MSDFASDASPETRAALRAALAARSSGPISVELDPALDGRIELDPCLSEPIESDPTLAVSIELDPSLSDYRLGDLSQPDVITRKRSTAPARESAAALDDGASAAVSTVTVRRATSEKSAVEPTFHPRHALVVPGAHPEETSNRPPRRADEAVGAAATGESTAPGESTVPGPLTEEPMFEQRDACDRAQPVEEEAAMAERTSEATPVATRIETAQASSPLEPVAPESSAPPQSSGAPAAGTGGMSASREWAPVPAADDPDAGADGIDDPSATVAVDDPSATVAADRAARDEDDGAAGTAQATDAAGRSDANDLFEALPLRARHFVALLERDGVLLMPEVMEHLGLVRPKGVGGAIEPIQRIARLLDAEVPFSVDFDPSTGHKRWTWRARPLVDVSPDLLEPIPAPAPQAKKPKPKKKADRSQYKRAWKRALASKKRKRRASSGDRPNAKRPPRPKRLAEAAPAASSDRPRSPGGPRGPDDASPARGARRTAAPTSGESRRRRQDRPMPEVFRRTNRPPSERPAPRREREEAPARVEQEERRPRVDERARPAAARVGVPRLDRAVVDPPRADQAAPATQAESAASRRGGVRTPEERLPLQRSGAFRRRTVGDTDVPVVVIRRRKR